jgi:hypothetical protein
MNDASDVPKLSSVYPLFLAAAILAYPSHVRGQGCLGFHGDPTSFFAQASVEHQAQDIGAGLSVFVNLKDRVAFGGGLTSGREHPFSSRTMDWRSLFAIGLPSVSESFCAYVELEQANHHFDNAFDLMWGRYHEQWGNIGGAYGKPFGSWLGMAWSGHVGVHVVFNRRVMRGAYLAPDEDLVRMVSESWDHRSVHAGGRLLLQLRRGNYGVSAGFRTLPRTGSDLVSVLKVAFII